MFPVVLTLIGLRARTSEGTAALSGFTQSVGYLIAAIGPFGMGCVYDLTGGWTVPLIGLIVLVVPAAGRRSGGRAPVVHRGRDRPLTESASAQHRNGPGVPYGVPAK